ncbi:MAG: hypothetical protein BroJett005_18800 [Ignavibacteriota bacterium]|nr:MAG: hypothetical protein BroJett005_18800 [Ignavibacteriota bacterium]
MSAQTKTRAQKAGKFLGIALFAFLMFFNIKFAVSDDTSGDIDLFGLKLSSTVSATYASGGDICPGSAVFCRYVVTTDGDIIVIVIDRQFYSV